MLVSSPIYRFLFCSPAREGKVPGEVTSAEPMVTSSHDVPGAGADTGLPGKMVKQDTVI